MPRFLPDEDEIVEELIESEEVIPSTEYSHITDAQRRGLMTALSNDKLIQVIDPTVVRVHEDALRARRVYLFNEIESEESVFEAITELHWMDQAPDGPIRIYMCTPGGSAFPGFALFDAIRSLRAPTETIGLGYVASMGSVLLQAGTRRLLGANSWLMVHEVSEAVAAGKTSQLADEVGLMQRLQKRMLDIYTERTKMSRKKIEKNWQRKDWWLTAQEALKLGFIDEILPTNQIPIITPGAEKPETPEMPITPEGGKPE
jgi:ATP-dependent Clp protease protease subunit